jgi:ribosomal-protein-alanine N-acetyltransferase
MALSPPNPPLADHVVSLRPLAAHDLPAVEQALDDPEITHWFDNRGLSASDVIGRAVSRWKRSEAAEFAILDGGECVGSMWLDLSPSDRAGVGYWLLPRARGKGLVTCALQLLTRWAFDDVGVKRISLLADPRNTASIAVAERVGFQREGVLRSWTNVNGERVDQVSFSLLPTDLS